MYEKLLCPFHIAFTNNIHSACRKNYPQCGSASLIKWRDIALWWVFYHLLPPLRHDDCVGSHRLLPLASRLSPIPIHFLGDIDGIVDGALTVDDGVMAINGVAQHKRVHNIV